MDKMTFAPSDDSAQPGENVEPWTIVVADDEGDVHMITKLVLSGFLFEGRPVEIISSFSGQETIEILKEHPDTAVLLLDVVMENYTAGLDVVNAVRRELGNSDLRIVLRSGQPGYSNVSAIIREYDINDYVRKESLRQQDLKDRVLIALRSYRDIQNARIEEEQ